jgi:uncharacterized Fe-S cluster protein YjdI
MTEIVRRYSKDGTIVVWQPNLCTHSGVCVRGLPEVFNREAHPWVEMNGAPVEQIEDQVRKCPSGALSLGE